MALAPAVRSVSDRVIGQFGETVKVAFVHEGDYDTATRTVQRVTVDHELTAVVSEKRERTSGTEVRKIAVLFSAAALPLDHVLTERDRLYVRQSEVQITAVKPIVVEGTVVAYSVEGRA